MDAIISYMIVKSSQ